MSLSSQSLAILKSVQDYKANNAEVVRASVQAANNQSNLFNAVSRVQSELKHDGLSAATIKAQQELSEKYGIPTFDVKGSISTLPSSGKINPDIDVGTGNMSDSDFKKSIDRIVKNQMIPASSGGGGFFDGITKGVTQFFDDIFKFDTVENLPDEIADQIDAIDQRISELRQKISDTPKPQIGSYKDTGAQRARTNSLREEYSRFVSQIQTKINELTKKRSDIILNYKTKTDVMDKIRTLIDDLIALSQVGTLTTELKVTIQEKIQEASKTVERILAENLNISQSTINEINRAVLLANERYKAPIQTAINDSNDNISGTAELIQLFPELFKNKSDNDKAEQLVKDYMIQKLAIQMALARGVFSK